VQKLLSVTFTNHIPVVSRIQPNITSQNSFFYVIDHIFIKWCNQLTEERRKELAKEVKKESEGAKIAVRNIRRDAMDEYKKQQKNGDMTEDDFYSIKLLVILFLFQQRWNQSL
jgi:hypothetical protein